MLSSIDIDTARTTAWDAADGVRTMVVVVSGDDASRWLELALHSYDHHAEFIRNIVVVTNDAPAVQRVLASCEYGTRVMAVLTDDWLLSMRERALGGWQRQQLVKLRAWTLTSDRYFVVADPDALLIRPMGLVDVLEAGHSDSAAVLYHHTFPGKSQSHIDFERRRIEELETLLEVHAPRTRVYGDFILDFFCFDRALLRSMGQWMDETGASSRLLQRFEAEPLSRTAFGEWTAYALYLLDVLHVDVPMRNGGVEYSSQLYRAARLEAFHWESRIVHFVDKALAAPPTYERLAQFGIVACGRRGVARWRGADGA